MRKIEQQMVEAVKAGKFFLQGNTCVEWEHGGNPCLDGTVLLHNNEIAQILPDGSIIANVDTFKEYPTATTCSRLRALGIGAHIVKGQPCIDGKPI